MPNHFYLIVKIVEDDYFKKAMQRFSTSYTKSINKTYNRVGHLFQGRYKAKLIPENNYLLHLSRYIHRNPVKAGLVGKPEQWKYSNYNGFINRDNLGFLDFDIIIDQVDDYAKFVHEFQEDQTYFVKDLLFK